MGTILRLIADYRETSIGSYLNHKVGDLILDAVQADPASRSLDGLL